MTAIVTKRANLPTLSSLRLIAALAVFAAHGGYEMVFGNMSIRGLQLFTAVPLALIGVSYFFVLSGFILTWTHHEGDSARAFWRRRFFRIYPSVLVALAATVALMAAFHQRIQVLPGLAQLLLLQAWVPDHNYFDNFDSVTWSLSVEFFCYALFPLLLPLTARIRPDRLWRWVAGIAAVIVAAPFFAYFTLPKTPADPAGQFSLLQVFFYMMHPDGPLPAVPGASM